MEEENKSKYEELMELMEKIELSMEMTREKQNVIDEMTEEIYDQPISMKVEDKKKEIEVKKEEKAEFDEMTKNALINSKKMILQVREESEKEYQERLLKIVEKRSAINKKLESMKKTLFDKGQLDKITVAEEKANNSLEKVNSEMKDFQDKHFELRKNLELQEKNIWDFAVELGVEQEIDSISLEGNINNPAPNNPAPNNPAPNNPAPNNPAPNNPAPNNPAPNNPVKNKPVIRSARQMSNVEKKELKNPELNIIFDAKEKAYIVKDNTNGYTTKITLDMIENQQGYKKYIEETETGNKAVDLKLASILNIYDVLRKEKGEKTNLEYTYLSSFDPDKTVEERRANMKKGNLSIEYDCTELRHSGLSRKAQRQIRKSAKNQSKLGIAKYDKPKSIFKEIQERIEAIFNNQKALSEGQDEKYIEESKYTQDDKEFVEAAKKHEAYKMYKEKKEQKMQENGETIINASRGYREYVKWQDSLNKGEIEEVSHEEDKEKNKFKESLKVGKDKLSKACKYTSEKLNRSKLLNNVRMHSEIAIRKATGYLKRENSLKIKADVRKIEENYMSK